MPHLPAFVPLIERLEKCHPDLVTAVSTALSKMGSYNWETPFEQLDILESLSLHQTMQLQKSNCFICFQQARASRKVAYIAQHHEMSAAERAKSARELLNNVANDEDTAELDFGVAMLGDLPKKEKLSISQRISMGRPTA